MKHLAFVVLALGACADPASSTPPGPDAGTPADTADAAPADAGPTDSGPAADAGPTDSGPVADAGPGADSGPLDSGPPPLPTEYPWRYGPDTPPADWFTAAPGCSSNDLIAKYFTYRRRFRGDGTAAFPGFTAIGLGPGHSLPAGVRIPSVDCPTHWISRGCRQDTVPNARGNLHYGDTTVWLGWYMASLGTEHRAFTLLGIDTTETARDIYYALQAFNRLDEVAETYFTGHAPALDGFFKRDDVPIGFIWTDSTKTALRFPRADGYLGYQCVTSGTTCGNNTTRDGYFMSQDQIIEMLPGLASIARLVPSTVVVEGVNLANEAKTITHRVVNYLRGNQWKIVDPTGESPPNEWGGTALPYSDQIAKSANFITGNAFGVADYRDTLSQTAGAALTGAVDVGWELQTLNNQAMVLALVTVSGDWGQDKLARRAADWNAPYYPMMNAALHGLAAPSGVSDAEVESMLALAPCGGPCHGTPGCEESPGWQGEHRFKSPEDRGGSTRGLDGEFPGIDFMLLHNLFVIAREGDSQIQWDPPPRCVRPGVLAGWLTNPPSEGDSYDPWDACNWQDFGHGFCGRTFAGWLDAAYHGRATVNFAGTRLVCSGFTPCVVALSSGGGAGDDLFIGSPGDDSFQGGGGSDCLMGFGGADTLEGGAGRDEIKGGIGNDLLCGENCNFTDVSGDPDMLFGEDGDDELQGGPSTDSLFGGEGADTLNGNQSFDFLYGGPGDDDLDGDLGPDQLFGGEGDDRLYGGVGEDFLRGGPGRDKIDGALGDDFIWGGPGDDFLMGSDGADRMSGESGDDRLCGGCGRDELDGGWNEDITPGTDQCRGPAVGFFCVNGDPAATITGCEASATVSECGDGAFDDW